jgi:hypothetical protein
METPLQRFSPPRGSCLGQILEGALGSLQRLKSREDFVPSSLHKPVLHLRDKDEPCVFVNAHEQRIEPERTGRLGPTAMNDAQARLK